MSHDGRETRVDGCLIACIAALVMWSTAFLNLCEPGILFHSNFKNKYFKNEGRFGTTSESVLDEWDRGDELMSK